MNSTSATEPPVELPIRMADPCVMVIFGASGDLTKRKLIPALCNLAAAKLLPSQFAVIGFAYNDLTTETFRQQLSADIKEFPQCRTPSACQLELADSGQFPEKKVHVSTLPLSNWRSGSKQSALPVEMDSAFFAKFREALAKYSSA